MSAFWIGRHRTQLICCDDSSHKFRGSESICRLLTMLLLPLMIAARFAADGWSVMDMGGQCFPAGVAESGAGGLVAGVQSSPREAEIAWSARGDRDSGCLIRPKNCGGSRSDRRGVLLFPSTITSSRKNSAARKRLLFATRAKRGDRFGRRSGPHVSSKRSVDWDHARPRPMPTDQSMRSVPMACL